MTLTIVVAAGVGLWIGALAGQKRARPWRWRLGGCAVAVLLACGGLAWENERALSAPRCYWCAGPLTPGRSPFVCPHCGVLDPVYRGYEGELERAEEIRQRADEFLATAPDVWELRRRETRVRDKMRYPH